MHEKNMTVSVLLDFYGDVLPERQREMLELYYNEDYSLAEISELKEISRQGVRAAVKKGETQLVELERQLGLVEKFTRMKADAERIASLLEQLAERSENPALLEEIACIAQQIKTLVL